MGDAPSPAPAVADELPIDWYIRLLATDVIAVALTGLLAVGFLAETIRSQYARRNSFLKLLASIAKSPLVHWLGQFQAFVINAPYWNELYLVWGVLLLIGFSSFYSTVEYTVYTRNKKKLMVSQEMIQAVNSLGALALLLYYTLWYTKVGLRAEHWFFGNLAPAPSDADPIAGDQGHFTSALWVIWGFSFVKILYQITSYYYADLISANNTKWVSFYMKRQKDVQNFDPKTMTGYRYLLVDEKPPKVNCNPPNYEIAIKDEEMKRLITIEDVWLSKGRLLHASCNDLGNKMKRTCLSFSLFRMLKRRFEEECETSEAVRPETRDFIRRGILEFPPEQVFKVIDTELSFLRDFFYTKYPTVLSFGLPLYALLVGVIFTSFFGIFRKLHHYIPPKNDLYIYKLFGQDGDAVVTKFILLTVMIIVGWELIRYIFSNWSMVWLVCKYVKYQRYLDHLLINIVCWVFCSICIPGVSTYEMGQYSLLRSCKIFHRNCSYPAKFISFGYIDRFMNVNYVSLKKVKIMEAIVPSLKQFLEMGLNHTAKITALSHHGIDGKVPSWVCEIRNPIQTVMIWHVATNFCWMKKKTEMKKKNTEPVAVNISNYCAYLVVYAPELLPVNTYVCNVIAKQIVAETCNFFRGTYSEKAMVKKMEEVEENEENAICRGALLGKILGNVMEDKDLWEFLKEVWVELILRLAPSETNTEHAKKLTGGGEFMTYLWVLLYHAGLINQASLKDDTSLA